MNRLQSSAFKGAWINYMATEEVDPRFADLDGWPLTSAMEAMWEGQLAAVAAIGQALPAITAATEAAKYCPRRSRTHCVCRRRHLGPGCSPGRR